jgi:hypothetical protein
VSECVCVCVCVCVVTSTNIIIYALVNDHKHLAGVEVQVDAVRTQKSEKGKAM